MCSWAIFVWGQKVFLFIVFETVKSEVWKHKFRGAYVFEEFLYGRKYTTDNSISLNFWQICSELFALIFSIAAGAKRPKAQMPQELFYLRNIYIVQLAYWLENNPAQESKLIWNMGAKIEPQ